MRKVDERLSNKIDAVEEKITSKIDVVESKLGNKIDSVAADLKLTVKIPKPIMECIGSRKVKNNPILTRSHKATKSGS